MYKTKIFYGLFKEGESADVKFNEWIEKLEQEGKRINIKNIDYEQAKEGVHSIFILYTEYRFEFGGNTEK